MQKPARNDPPIHELLRQRWSPRAFADQAIPEEVLRSLFEAARWAPSSFNEQPWAYMVARKEDQGNFQKVLETLVVFNASWGKEASLRSKPQLAVRHGSRNGVAVRGGHGSRPRGSPDGRLRSGPSAEDFRHPGRVGAPCGHRDRLSGKPELPACEAAGPRTGTADAQADP